MGTSLLQSLGPDAAVIALKGRNIIAQVVRPGFGVFLHIPACKVGTMSDQTIPPYPLASSCSVTFCLFRSAKDGLPWGKERKGGAYALVNYGHYGNKESNNCPYSRIFCLYCATDGP